MSKLTASAYNRLTPVCQQSWSQGTLAVSSPAVAEAIASTLCTLEGPGCDEVCYSGDSRR